MIQYLLPFIPAFVANGAPTLVRRGHPIDLGFSLKDGNRVLGDGKTFEGLIMGLTFALVVSEAESSFMGFWWILQGSMVGLFALMGDMVGAFIKRRLRIARGDPAPILDQLDFVFGATVGLSAVGYKVTLGQIVYVSAIALVLHVLTNRVAFRLRLKNVPW